MRELEMLADLFLYVGATLGALLPIVNPISAAPVFLGVTSRSSTTHRIRQARLAAFYTGCILLCSFFAGSLILEFFGISLPVLRVAGGLVITRVGFGMLGQSGSAEASGAGAPAADGAADVAFTPVAMPMLAGPGSMAVTIAMATEAHSFVSDAGVVIGIAIVSALAWVTLHFSGSIIRFIGETGMNALTRVMGLILVCIGITFVATGIVVGLTSEPMLSVLKLLIADLQPGTTPQ
ncbi:MAG: MarC family NAAT transporter [Gammaproteobacteria bacterium]|jgi:multiple antibiotic resistance protein